MGDEEAVIRSLFEAFARRDIDAALPLLDPDAEFWPEGTASRVRRDVPYRGHEGMREYFRDVAAAWDELRVEPQDFRAAGGGVVVFGRALGRAGDEVLDQPVIWVWKLREGRVVFGRVVPTMAAAEAVAREQTA